jgi:hypothetical protein
MQDCLPIARHMLRALGHVFAESAQRQTIPSRDKWPVRRKAVQDRSFCAGNARRRRRTDIISSTRVSGHRGIQSNPVISNFISIRVRPSTGSRSCWSFFGLDCAVGMIYNN